MRMPCPSDLTGERWDVIRPLIPSSRVGRHRKLDPREVLNTIFYQARSGCPWDMIPHDLPLKGTVHDDFARWRDEGT